MKLQAGDFFCVTNDSIIQQRILWGTRLMSVDNKSEYGHCGIITTQDGITFEAVEKYSRHDFFSRYAGCNVLVGRHVGMTPASHQRGMITVGHLEGLTYPFFRLALWMLPLMPKWIHFGKPVCSELVFWYGEGACLKDIDYHWGVSPDYVADAVQRWDVFDVIYKGVLNV